MILAHSSDYLNGGGVMFTYIAAAIVASMLCWRMGADMGDERGVVGWVVGGCLVIAGCLLAIGGVS